MGVCIWVDWSNDYEDWDELLGSRRMFFWTLSSVVLWHCWCLCLADLGFEQLIVSAVLKEVLLIAFIWGTNNCKHWHGVGRQSSRVFVIFNQYIYLHLLYFLGYHFAICRQWSLCPPVFPSTRIRHTCTCICWHGASLLLMRVCWICDA